MRIRRPAAAGTDASGSAAATAAAVPGASSGAFRGVASRYGVVVALMLMIVVFGALRPDSFLTSGNLTAILMQCAPVAIVAFGLTIVLAMNEFDLSITGQIGLITAVVVVLMTDVGLPVVVSVVLVIALGGALGAINGTLIAVVGAPSFIITLAAGQILGGGELLLTDGAAIFEGIPAGFGTIGSGEIFGVNRSVVIAVVAFGLLFVMLERTELGRQMRAIGSNVEASRIAGLPVRRTVVLGFVIVGLCTAVAGVILASQANAYSRDLGVSFFLPTYAAVFLGAAVIRPGTFNLVGTAIGVLFLEVAATGLTMLSLSTAVILITQGFVLAVAVLLSTVQRGAAR